MTHQPRKRFGQHFLHDPGVIARIVNAIDPLAGQRIVEIGPGLGALTRPLLERAGRVEAVEIDRDAIVELKRRCAGVGELLVHEGDALEFDFAALAADGRKLRVCGNLPYNVSTPLLFHLLSQSAAIEDMHFMLQREVVERLAAKPDTREYGRLTVMLAAACRVEALFRVGRGAFQPPPQVESAVVRLVPLAEPPFRLADRERFARIVSAGFSGRRKTIRNSLRDWVDEAGFAAAGVDPGRRADTLSPAEFAALAAARGPGGPARQPSTMQEPGSGKA